MVRKAIVCLTKSARKSSL